MERINLKSCIVKGSENLIFGECLSKVEANWNVADFDEVGFKCLRGSHNSEKRKHSKVTT